MTSNELQPCPMNNLKSSIAERVSYLRELHNESLQDVADAIGCSKTHLHELEKGKSKNPSINLLRGLAIHFMVPVAALVENEITAQYRLIRAAQEPQTVPAGWKLVPIEPTDEMLMAYKEADGDHSDDESWLEWDGGDAARLYKAMLAAAPEPSADEVKE